MKKEIMEIKKETSMQNIKQNKVNYMKKKKQIKKSEKTRNPFRSQTHDHKISKITHYLWANLCLLAATLSNTNKNFVLSIANTEMYEAIIKLRNYRIIYANFIHEYGVNFHELYIKVWMSLNFGQISSLTMELPALDHLKNIVSPGFLHNFYSDLFNKNWHNILSV